jgi:hypothetical protein
LLRRSGERFRPSELIISYAENGMRVFVGFGYNDRDRWIEQYIFDLIRAFGGEPVTGKEIFGQPLGEGVRDHIRTSDALLGFTTRRDKINDQLYTTHRWVTDEIATAIEARRPFVEIRETSVDPQFGIPVGHQYIVYDPEKRDACLVEVAKALGKWQRSLPVRLQLAPEAITQALRPFIRKPGFRCSYQIYENGIESQAKESNVIGFKGGLFVHVPAPGPLAAIRICIEADGKTWTSDYESVDAVSVALREG